MRKLGIAVIVVIWVLIIVACATGEWIDTQGYPVQTGWEILK